MTGNEAPSSVYLTVKQFVYASKLSAEKTIYIFLDNVLQPPYRYLSTATSLSLSLPLSLSLGLKFNGNAPLSW